MRREVVILCLAVLSGTGRAQTAVAPAKTPVFDVVSIRENKSENVRRDYGPQQTDIRRARSLLS
jgi:hypothetical protein